MYCHDVGTDVHFYNPHPAAECGTKDFSAILTIHTICVTLLYAKQVSVELHFPNGQELY